MDCYRAIILGAGGSARAVVYALLQVGWEVTVAARRLSQVQDLISSFQHKGTLRMPGAGANPPPPDIPNAISLDQNSLARYLTRAASHEQGLLLIVNTTPLGMTPESAASPWPAAIPFPSRAMLYDLVYNPAETLLLQTARSQGIPSVNGLGMLVEQAALSFELWTGFQPPRQAIYAALTDETEPKTSGAR
jgi:shikimate dehydrogenase